MSTTAKYAVIKQAKTGKRRVIESFEYEVRKDARDFASAKNRTAVNYHYYVVALKPGKIKRLPGASC